MLRTHLYLLLLLISACISKPAVENIEVKPEHSVTDPVKPLISHAVAYVYDSAMTARNNELGRTMKSIRDMQVLTSVKQNDSLASTGESFYDQCDRWNLTPQQIEMISKASVAISGSEWHYLYDVLPCSYNGKAVVNGQEISYSFHAGSYFMLYNPDTTMYYGYTGKKFRKLFLSGPSDEKE